MPGWLTINFNHYLRFFLSLILLTVSIQYAEAYPATEGPNPAATVIDEWNPAVVNQYLEKWDPNIVPGVTDPFDLNYAVSEVVPVKVMYFVRIFSGADTNALGSWIVRASVVRGKTPEQIRDILALPGLPTKMAYVKVPVGAQYGLWTGIAGRIMSPGYEWGNGGAEQTKIIGKQTNGAPPADPARFADYSRLPGDSYMNVGLLGNNALSYSVGVRHGTAGKVAAYLDHHLPQPYSDMDFVYTTLDFINEDGPRELAAALRMMSPIGYDSFSSAAFRNDLLFNNILFEHTAPGTPSSGNDMASKKSASTSWMRNNCANSWLNVSVEQDQQSEAFDRIGFTNQVAALVGGVDCRISTNTMVGIDAGYFHNHIGWNGSAGDADVNNVKLGFYSNYTEAEYFLLSALSGGYNWGSANRNMNFSGNGIAVLSGLVVDTLDVNRSASSKPTGKNAGLYFTGGRNFEMREWIVVPMAKLSYFYAGQNEFDESGADDLNLRVNDFSAQTIRTQLAVLVGRSFSTQKGAVINANLQLGWAHNFPLDNRNITASYPSLGGEFSVNGYYDQTNEALITANLSNKMTRNVWVNAQYNADLSHGFNAQALSLIVKYYLDA